MRFGISTISRDMIYCAYAIIVLCDEEEIEIPTLLGFNNICDWGETNCSKSIDVKPSDISYLEIAWKSSSNELYFKKKITNLSTIISNLPEGFQQNLFIKIGLTPYGIITLWAEHSYGQRELLMVDVVTNGINHNTSPEFKIALKQVKQFSYRFIISESINDTENSIHIKILGFDGTRHHYTNSTIYSKFESRGVPSKLLVQILKKEYSVQSYLWFESSIIYEFFERFYGAHPDTKADFIIRIDAENKKYGLSLYRQGLKEPVVIPESAYQLIVFKNKFEDYRSENYNQPRGAWIW